MFNMIPQLIVFAALVAIVIILLRRLPEVTVPEDRPDPAPVARSLGERVGRAVRTAKHAGFKAVTHVTRYAVEAKDHTFKAHYLERFSKVLNLQELRQQIRPFGRKRAGPAPASVQVQSPGEDPAVLERNFIKAIKLDPHDRQAYEGLGKLYLSRGQNKEASEVYDYLTKTYPDNDSFFSKLGGARFGMKDYSGAIEAYQRALEIDPAAANRLINLGLCYEALGDFDSALDKVRQAVKSAPENLQFRFIESELLVRMNRMGEATAVLEGILEQDPANDRAREGLAKIKFSQPA